MRSSRQQRVLSTRYWPDSKATSCPARSTIQSMPKMVHTSGFKVQQA